MRRGRRRARAARGAWQDTGGATIALLVVLGALTVVPGGAARTQPAGLTEAEFRKAMVAEADALAVATSLVDSPAYLLNSARGDVVTRISELRRQMVGVRAFFDVRGEREAVDFADDLRAALDLLDREVTAAEPNPAEALEALGAVRGACAACHRVYRTGDRRTGFGFAPGVL